MFSNRFNTKNDPLIEAVKQAQADGDLRRQAVAIVNEAFGVFSRNAVIREELAEYDAAVESTYTDLKEGKWEGSKEDKDEDKKLAKKHGMSMKQWEKSAADKKHDAKEKCDEEYGNKRDYRKVDIHHKGQYKATTTWAKNAKEAKAKYLETNKDYDPKDVKTSYQKEELAKKDYDKDGKVESPKDEVWGSRLRAARKAGKLREGLDVVKRDPSVQGSGDVTKSAPKEDPSTPKSYPGAASTVNGPNPTSQRMSNAVKENVTAPKEWAMKAKTPNKNAVTKAPVPGVSIAEAAYSAKAARAGKDIGKPGKMFAKIASKAGKKYGSAERGKKVAGAILAKIRAKHMKENADNE